MAQSLIQNFKIERHPFDDMVPTHFPFHRDSKPPFSGTKIQSHSRTRMFFYKSVILGQLRVHRPFLSFSMVDSKDIVGSCKLNSLIKTFRTASQHHPW